MHVLDGGVEIIGIEIFSREANEAWGSVVSKVDEHLAVLVRLQNLAVASSSFASLSLNDSQEVGWCNVFAAVIDVAASVNVFTVWFVEHLTRERILSVVGDVIIGQGDNLILRDSVFLHDLVGMADIGLMSVVAIARGAGDKDSPVVRGGGMDTSSEGQKNGSS